MSIVEHLSKRAYTDNVLRLGKQPLYLPVAYAAQPERVKWLASGLARGV
jgi:hypothetical protein